MPHGFVRRGAEFVRKRNLIEIPKRLTDVYRREWTFRGARMKRITLLILWAAVVVTGSYAQDGPKKVSPQAALSAAATKIQPQYPEMAKKMGIAGTVDLEAVIDEAGSVEKVETVAGNPILVRAGTDAL